eukprot:1184734-Prorocentrum_minimum.AAC.1
MPVIGRVVQGGPVLWHRWHLQERSVNHPTYVASKRRDVVHGVSTCTPGWASAGAGFNENADYPSLSGGNLV